MHEDKERVGENLCPCGDIIYRRKSMLGKRTKLTAENEWEFLGTKQNYRVVGAGMPVILLHGSMIANPWGGFEMDLAKHFKVYLPDLPGFGASEAVEGRVHDTQLFAEAFGQFIKTVKLEQAPIIAFSLGAVVAVKTAALNAALGELVLVGLPIRLESKLLEQVCRMPLLARRVLAANELTRGGLVLSVLRDIIGVSEAQFLPTYLRLLKTTDVRAMIDADWVSEVEKELPWYLHRVKNPMRYVYGERDKLKRGAEKWLAGKIHVVKGAGHDVFVGQPEETLKLLRQLLERKPTFWDKIKKWIGSW
jgi:pimeloyl-ACP methyl ester carboxylesterase